MIVNVVPAFSIMGIRSFRRRYFGENTSLIVASMVTGLLAALAAVALKAGVNELTRLLHGWLFGERRELLTLVIPTAGILLCVVFTRYVLKKDLGIFSIRRWTCSTRKYSVQNVVYSFGSARRTAWWRTTNCTRRCSRAS